MATHSISLSASDPSTELNLARVATFPRMRALAWCNSVLYASRGYTVLRATMNTHANIEWTAAGHYRPPTWRSITSSSRLASRLFRDGFHALVALSSGYLVAAVPHAIVTLAPGETEFCVSHKLLRGTRPLHIAVTPNDHVFWGEYFDNPHRDEVHIYASTDRGAHWEVAHTFLKGTIRHVHNIVYDEWENVFGCSQAIMARSAASSAPRAISKLWTWFCLAASKHDRLRWFPPGTPCTFLLTRRSKANYVYRLGRRGDLSTVATLNSSSIYGCLVGNTVFFSTMVEPSAINSDNTVSLYASADGVTWKCFPQGKKDRWPMGLFQYGNAFLPDGKNTTNLIAVTAIAIERADLETTIWRI